MYDKENVTSKNLPWNYELGQRLKKEALEHGILRAKGLSNLLHVDRSVIYSMYHGNPKRKLSMAHAEVLEREWGVNKWWFYGIGGRTLEETQQLQTKASKTKLQYLKNLGITINPLVDCWSCNYYEFAQGMDTMEIYLSKPVSKFHFEPDAAARGIVSGQVYRIPLRTLPDFSENSLITLNDLPSLPFESVTPPEDPSSVYQIFQRNAANPDDRPTPIGSICKLHAVYIDYEFKGYFTPAEIDNMFFSVDQVAKAAATAFIETAVKEKNELDIR